MRRMTMWLATTLIVVGCGQATPEPAPTTTVFLAPPTTEAEPSTTIRAEPIDICARGLLWDVASRYGAGCFIVPLSFQPDEDGWRSGGAGDTRIRIDWREPGEDIAIRMVVLAYEPQLDGASVLEQIIAIDGLKARVSSQDVSVGSLDAVTVDVDTDPDPQSGPNPRECSSHQYLVAWPYDALPGYPLVVDSRSLSGTREYGLGACATFRIWVVDIEGTTITILATTEDQSRFEKLIPKVERLLESMSVDGSR